jgi:hypothetical protein
MSSPGQEAITEATLAILLENHPALLSIEEIGAELSNPEAPLPPTTIKDAIDELRRLGLAHCIEGQLAVASCRALKIDLLRGQHAS